MPAWIKGDVLDVRSAVNSAFVLNRNRRRHRHHSLVSYATFPVYDREQTALICTALLQSPDALVVVNTSTA